MKKLDIERWWENMSFKEQMSFLVGFGMSYKEATEIYSEKWSELPVEIKAFGKNS